MIDTISNYLSSLTAEHYFFFLFAIVAIASSLEVVMQRSPLYSAVALIFTMAALAANFVLLKAQFLAAIQIIVYAGAIIVLFVFVIMLLNLGDEARRAIRIPAPEFAVLVLTFLAPTVPDGRSEVAGYAARGVAFALVGWFLVTAGLQHDPQEVRGLDGALVGAMYPHLDDFRALCARVDPDGVLQSDLSRRLGLR